MFNTRKILHEKSKIPGAFVLDPETRRQLRERYLEVCADIFRFCETHQLCCMLGGGSVLGAVRHQGFIPWDDDMDLNMPRKDYDTFAALFSEEMKDKYEVFVPDGRHRITNLFMKISLKNTLVEDIYTAGSPIRTGVCVDIFPIENVPGNSFLACMKGILSDIFAYSAVSAYIFQNRNPKMKAIYTQTRKGKRNYLLRCLLGAVLSFRNYTWWYCKFDKFAQSSSNSDQCTVPTGRRHYRGELRNKQVFYPVRYLLFEKIPMPVPHDTYAYIKQLYGNYLALPPENEREAHFYTKIDLIGKRD